MKPQPPFAPRRFPITDCAFQSNLSDWRSSSWGDDDDWAFHRFNEFNREFRRESLRERRREMVAFAVMMLIIAWPILYMVYTIAVLLLERHHPIN